MEILINNEIIPFELEGEKNAFEIVSAIGLYASKNDPQHFITSISVNGKEYSYADENGLKNIMIEDIDKLEIETSGLLGISILSIDQVDKFLNLLITMVNQNQYDESLVKIKDSMLWMKDGVKQVVGLFFSKKNRLINDEKIFSNEFDKINLIIKHIDAQGHILPDNIIESFNKSVKTMKGCLNNIRTFLKTSEDMEDKDKILENLNSVIGDIEKLIPGLSSAPILFQTGDDNLAMETIQNLANILERSINLFIVFKEDSNLHLDKYTTKEVTFEVFFETLTNHLKELMSSIENNDSIMMGDLLEYEFIPNIEEISGIFKRIRDEAFIKAN